MFSLSQETLSPADLAQSLSSDAAGALVVFEGRVRNHNEGRDVTSLEYEAYRNMAEKEGEAVLREAMDRFAIIDALCVHRTGRLAIGDIAVWIGVLGSHRDAAFQACRFVIDEIKLRVPVWKREHYCDGSTEWRDSPG